MLGVVVAAMNAANSGVSVAPATAKGVDAEAAS